MTEDRGDEKGKIYVFFFNAKYWISDCKSHHGGFLIVKLTVEDYENMKRNYKDNTHNNYI